MNPTQARSRYNALASKEQAISQMGLDGSLEFINEALAQWIPELGNIITVWATVEHMMSGPTIDEVAWYTESMLNALDQAADRAMQIFRQSGSHSGDARSAAADTQKRLTELVNKATDRSRVSVTAALDSLNAVHELSRGTDLDFRAGRIEELDDRAEAIIGDLEPKVEALRIALSESAAVHAVQGYADRASDHQAQEKVWERRVAISAVLLGVALFVVFLQGPPSSFAGSIAYYLVRNALMIGGVSLALRVSIRRWNLERNLAILYTHRVAAFKQYLVLDGSISSSQPEAKERLRQQFAAVLLVDPATGYLDEAASGVTISPVTVLDRLTSSTNG